MKIAELVKRHIKQIFFHCDNLEHSEINSLLDPQYSKQMFGINFPFCIELEHLEPSQSKRYWTEIYLVRGKRVRVTSQWYEANEPLFLKYLQAKSIASVTDFLGREKDQNTDSERQDLYYRILTGEPIPEKNHRIRRTPKISNSRYRGNHIGNAQNLFIRNILSNLGQESFSEEDWNSTKNYFSHKCAYCDAETELLIEHAVPINKEKLGEHRLGNLLPSCKSCNKNKGGRDFREFLGENIVAINRIKEYMDSKNYVPLEDNEQMKMILEMAHKEIAALADRYITIINALFPENSTPNT